MHVVVVGGGVIGASVTYRLAQAGVRVTLLEAGRLAGGTSAATFAWINANNKPPLEYHRLNAAGLAEYSRLRQEFGTAPWLHLDGNLAWAEDARGAEALRSGVTRLHDWGYDADWLPIAALRDIEPDLRPPRGVTEFAFFPSEGYVDVPPLVGVFAAAAERLGAAIRTGCRVTAFITDRGRVRGVTTAAGDRVDADLVVSCAGRWTDQVAALAGVRVPLAPKIGMLAITSPSSVGLRSVVHLPGLSIRPDGAGRIMLWADAMDRAAREDMPLAPPPAACGEALERTVGVLPGLAGAGIETVRIGVRPMPEDGYTVAGPMPGAEGVYVVCTHSGVTLGPLLGRLAAQEIAGGPADSRLRAFRPERLTRRVEA